MKHLRVRQPQCALQLTRIAPISTGQLERTYELWSHPQCSKSARDVGSLVGTGSSIFGTAPLRDPP